MSRVFTASWILGSAYERFGLAHGLLRKTVQLHDAQVYNYDTGAPEDIFVTTKIALGAYGVAVNVWVWPLFLAMDIHSLEGRLRGYEYPPKERKSVSDYMLN